MHTKHVEVGREPVTVVLDTPHGGRVELVNRNGRSDVYFTVDGSTPTVLGDDSLVLLSDRHARTSVPAAGEQTTVRLVIEHDPVPALVTVSAHPTQPTAPTQPDGAVPGP